MGPVGPVPGRPPRPQPSSGQAGRGPLPAGLVTGGEVDEQAAGAAHVFALEDRDAGRDVDQHHRAARAGLHRPEGNDPALPKPIAPFGLTRLSLPPPLPVSGVLRSDQWYCRSRACHPSLSRLYRSARSRCTPTAPVDSASPCPGEHAVLVMSCAADPALPRAASSTRPSPACTRPREPGQPRQPGQLRLSTSGQPVVTRAGIPGAGNPRPVMHHWRAGQRRSRSLSSSRARSRRPGSFDQR